LARIVYFVVIEMSRHPECVKVVYYIDTEMPRLIAHVAYVVAPQQPDRGVGMSQVVYPKKIKRL